jgi:hypothetical protein
VVAYLSYLVAIAPIGPLSGSSRRYADTMRRRCRGHELRSRCRTAAKRRAPSFVVLPIVSQPLPDPLGFVRATGLDGLNCPPRMWTADLIQAFRDRKLVVHSSPINDVAELRGSFAIGGQTADSDNPELFG